MKLTKRIATFVLALTLALALVVTTSAAEPPVNTIQVTGDPDPARHYDIYKMFSVEDGNDSEENLYIVTEAWEDFVADLEYNPSADTGYFTLNEVTKGDKTITYVNYRKNPTTAADAAIIAELAKTYAIDNDLDSVGSVTVGGAAVELAEDGYYLLVASNGTLSGVQVIKNGANLVITEKAVTTGVPQLTKEVYEDSLQGFAPNNTVDVGVPFRYRITITAGAGATKYVLHDVMDEHIDFLGLESITRGGNEVLEGEYDLVENPGDGCRFHIAFHEDWCQSLNEGAKIVITYNAVLKGEPNSEGIYSEVATGDDHPHTNTAWLRYTDVETVKTEPATVNTTTYEINILKTDGSGAALDGAGFKLRDNEKNYYIYDERTGVVSWGTKEQGTEVFSDAEGKLRFYGVDAEIFYLEETTFPGGYTGVESTQISTKTGNVASGSVIIKNTLGNAMPETGGMGTTALYIGGAALVLCALATLVIIKRKNTAA